MKYSTSEDLRIEVSKEEDRMISFRDMKEKLNIHNALLIPTDNRDRFEK